MTHRDRVLTALAHEEPDRVPFDYWAAPEFTLRLGQHLGCASEAELLEHLGVDLRYVKGPSYVGQELRRQEDGTVEDLWGVRRRAMTVERDGFTWTYKHVAVSPLERMQTVADIEAYDRWPSADWWDYSGVEAECAEHRGYAVVNAGDRLDRTAQLKTMMYLRGGQQAFIDLKLDPTIVDCILEHVRSYFLEYNERVFRAADGGIDVFMMGDDFGTQHGPMMDIATWRRHFLPGLRAYIELAHRYRMKVMHHTCGAVSELIPDLIDAGLDILQSLQPRAAGMELSRLKREYGKHICFHGSVDIQQTLPQGSPQDVREHVRERMDAGKPGGGFIICTAHNIQPDTSVENVVALFEAYNDFGRYT